MAKNTVVPPPPRVDFAAQDPASVANTVKVLIDWVNAFYRSTVVESGLLDPKYQATADNFDPQELPDPESSSIAKAQQTANEAYKVGASANAKALQLTSTFVLSDTNNQISLTFSAPLADENYGVIVQANDFTGTPSASAFLPSRVTKTKADCTITMAAAPGSGASVSFVVFLFPLTS